jgi:hypothetical protein
LVFTPEWRIVVQGDKSNDLYEDGGGLREWVGAAINVARDSICFDGYGGWYERGCDFMRAGPRGTEEENSMHIYYEGYCKKMRNYGRKDVLP